jgi:hypothetical protein
MDFTEATLRKSVAKEAFGSVEPFLGANDHAVSAFYGDVLAALENAPGIGVHRELDHHGSGYASYVSAFLYPSDGRSRRDLLDYTETTGILLYMSRLAPIAAFGASERTDSKAGRSSTSGFIGVENVGLLPNAGWEVFLTSVRGTLHRFGIELLAREPLVLPAPTNLSIPTVFEGPYFVVDTLFYWAD